MSDDVPYFVNGAFLLDPEQVQPERHGRADLYVPPAAEGPLPAVVFVCGGPLPAEAEWINPREWPVYRGYGHLLAANGLIAAPLQLPLHEWDQFPGAADALKEAIEQVRADERVDSDRIAIWFFCGGSPLISDYLRTPPPWLRVMAATYPALGSRPHMELEPRFEPSLALAEHGDLPPIVLTRVGLEAPLVAETVEKFVAAAEEHQVDLTIIDVPNGHHGFDIVDHTEESREAVHQALNFVRQALVK